MKQSMIANLKAQKSKQSATIAKLKEEITKLGVTIQSTQQEAAKQGRRVELLMEEAEAEKLARLAVQANALSYQRALQSARVELEEMRAAHQAALADIHSIESRLRYVTSEEGKREVIEGYRHGPVGKVELSLAVKAGYDFLKAQFPPSALTSATATYPSRVQSCLGILQDLEARGGGIQLGFEEEEDDEDEDEEDDGGDAGDDPK